MVATPIGNLGDLSPRAVATLAVADLVLCEDSRVTGGLLHKLGIKRPLQPYHDHNAERIRPVVLDRLRAGAVIALVSDAGTPCIADPGFKLVREAAAAGIEVVAVPGPSAVLAALAIGGLPTDRFLFEGFLPSKAVARDAALAELRPIRATLVLLESPHRLGATLAAAARILGRREAALARELTKRFEEVRRGTLDSLAAAYAEHVPKGEIVIVIGPPSEVAAAPVAEGELDAMLENALARLPPRKAAAEVAAATGVSANTLYARAVALRAR